MSRALIHIGLPKTGSSALQSFLDSAASALIEKRYFYQATPFSSNTIHSGNGGPLFAHASNNDYSSLLQAIKPLIGPPDSTSLISCELFCHLNDLAVSILVDALSSFFEEITYVGYVRTLSSYYYSEYTQSLKRHDETRSFRDFVKEGQLNAYAFPRRLGMSIRKTDQIQLRTYTDKLDFCIIADFLELLDIPELSPQLRLNLNRSLTPFESQVFRFLNLQRQLSGSASIKCTDVSDLYLQIQKDSPRNTPLVSHDVLSMIHERHSEEIGYINGLLTEQSSLATLDQEKARITTLARASMVELDGLLLGETESQSVRSLQDICEVYKILSHQQY